MGQFFGILIEAVFRQSEENGAHGFQWRLFEGKPGLENLMTAKCDELMEQCFLSLSESLTHIKTVHSDNCEQPIDENYWIEFYHFFLLLDKLLVRENSLPASAEIFLSGG